MKKISLFLALSMLVFSLAGCGDAAATSNNPDGAGDVSYDAPANSEDTTVDNTDETSEEEQDENVSNSETEPAQETTEGGSVDDYIDGDFFDIKGYFHDQGADLFYIDNANGSVVQENTQSSPGFNIYYNTWSVRVPYVSEGLIVVAACGKNTLSQMYTCKIVHTTTDTYTVDAFNHQLSKDAIITLSQVMDVLSKNTSIEKSDISTELRQIFASVD